MRKNPPLYQTVRDRLLERIGNGELSVGDRLEPEIELAGSYGVSRATMRSAIRDLVQASLLVRRPGIGTMVVRSRPRVTASGLSELIGTFAGTVADSQLLVLDSSMKPASDEAAGRLGTQPGSNLLRVYTICKSAGQPVAICETWLAAGTGISPAEPHVAPIYDLLEKTYGRRISHGDDAVTAVLAKGETARLLDVRSGSPLISIERVAFDGGGAPLLYSRAQFLSENYTYRVTLARDVHSA